MRRTVFSAMALACAAVLAGTVPAFADGGSTTPAPAAPTLAASPVPSATDAPTPAPSTEPTRAPAPGEVSVVPSGAPDTGQAPTSTQSGSESGLIAGGAAAVLVGGGAAVFLVRRQRATGA
ncbi:sortase-dependent protein [Streptomyces sp. ALI-76-A]|uniref:sortase-dependent protein n=1 Tax=Streptomyces sp. ALI-76-A TaxID=3025736 RepID=UPI00256F3A4B|nr:sortase-dependent protein [Streptomyces sp. ALI-76-A]MDL5206055.1 sortase-dependent protein [Streptomyces sp. ALI-76-A]